jgi:hypothetical protein
MTFDEQVAALRGKVEPKQFSGKKADATPEQWAAHLEAARRWHAANRESAREAKREAMRRWRAANRDKAREAARRRRAANRESARRWKAANPEKNREANRKAHRRWRAKQGGNVKYRLAWRMRQRLGKAVRRSSKSGSAVRDLGCSIEELKAHIERQWVGCMSWENWGSGPGTWQIDHIYPLAQTDLTDRAQLLAACNWRNLQPMWFEDNVRKGDTVTPEAQQLFDGLVSEFTEVRDEVA